VANAPDGKSIIIAGEYYPLGGKVKVVTFNDQGSYPDVLSFHAPEIQAECTATAGQPCFGPRYLKPGQPATNMEMLIETVNQIVFHIDGCHDAAMCYRVLKGRGLSTHFIIDWDGTIYQCLDVLECGYHAGAANNKAIGIDLNNLMKNLVKEPGAEMYPPGHPRIDEMNKKEYKRPKSDVQTIAYSKVQAYGYNEPQYEAIIELLRVLIERLPNIKKEYPVGLDGEVIRTPLEDAASHAGFMAHWHWEAQRWDPGPGFDWARVYHSLQGGKNAFPIDFEGQNISTLVQPALVREHADKLCRMNETQTHGWYPMGANQTWHGGIHLKGTKGEPVYAMIPGVLVAARFGKNPTKLGNNNFVLLKHVIPMAQPAVPGSEEPPKPKDLVFYSLYMHLDAMDVSKAGDDSVEWLRDLYKSDKGKADAEEGGLDKAPSPDGEPDDAVIDDILAEEDEGGDDALDKAGWLRVGLGVGALRKGEIALIPHEKGAITVGPGDIIGRVGQFGLEGEWTPQIHVEIFAEPTWKDAIDMGVHGRFFTELAGDMGADIFVENREIIGLFGGATRRGSALVPQRVLDSSVIETFWSSAGEYEEEKRYMRRLVTRHVSEWSDMVDWVLSLSKAEGWDDRTREFKALLSGSSIGKDAITSVLPFIWLNKDVAKHIGLDVTEWRGVLDHFHPLHFLQWLMYNSVSRAQALATGMSKKKAIELAKKEEAEARRCAQIPTPEGCENTLRSNDEEFVPSTLEMVEEFDTGDVGAELDVWFNEKDQGEWERPPRK
jgi:N-acetyl-anhydromuramyl-L-alanine amidase AmpD